MECEEVNDALVDLLDSLKEGGVGGTIVDDLHVKREEISAF